jgi:hypothetical protein
MQTFRYEETHHLGRGYPSPCWCRVASGIAGFNFAFERGLHERKQHGRDVV